MIVFGAPVIRRYDLLAGLLGSLHTQTQQPDRVVVVDNGNDAAKLPCCPALPAQVISPGRNVGCAGAWNLIIDQASAPEDIVIISNDDIELMPESISMIVQAAQRSELVIAHNFSLFSVRRSLVDKIGFFDEHFFPSYYEDNDFHRRVKLAGASWEHIACPCTHAGSASLTVLSAEEQKAVRIRIGKCKSQYLRKWGGVPGQERYKKPFKGNLPRNWDLRPETCPS